MWGEQARLEGGGAERHRRRDSGRKGPLKGGRSSFKLVATPERSKHAEHLAVLLPPGRARVSRCSMALSRWSSLRPEAYLQFRRPAALAACSTVGICRGFLLGRPAKNEPHRIVAAAATLAQRRSHGAGLEPARPTHGHSAEPKKSRGGLDPPGV